MIIFRTSITSFGTSKQKYKEKKHFVQNTYNAEASETLDR